MKPALCLALLALTACSPKVVTKDRPVIVNRPVAVPCVTNWPQRPPPLPDGSHWVGMDVRMKSAALGKYAIDMTNYSEALAAATGGCAK